MKIALNAYSKQLVRKYASQFLRDAEDVVNGLVTSQLEHAYEEETQPTHDDSMEHVHEAVLLAAKARSSMKGRRAR